MPAVTRLQRSLGDWIAHCSSQSIRASRRQYEAATRRAELRASAAHRRRGLHSGDSRPQPALVVRRRPDRSGDRWGKESSWKAAYENRKRLRQDRGGFLPKDQARLRALAVPVNRILAAVKAKTASPQDGGSLVRLLKKALPLFGLLARSFPFDKEAAAGSVGWDWTSFKEVLDLLAGEWAAERRSGPGLDAGRLMEEMFNLFHVKQEQEDASASRCDRYPATNPTAATPEDPMDLTLDIRVPSSPSLTAPLPSPISSPVLPEDPMDLVIQDEDPMDLTPEIPFSSSLRDPTPSPMSSPVPAPISSAVSSPISSLAPSELAPSPSNQPSAATLPSFLAAPTVGEDLMSAFYLMGLSRQTPVAVSDIPPFSLPAPMVEEDELKHDNKSTGACHYTAASASAKPLWKSRVRRPS
ncbi:hypothetical protein IQ07DRAFT_640670 [Pyrenochaeta sp. DS3sAY3a]|nr:hypothetical protein IQ07DRAFT_640670 [Pyrenochaeta sp. DS3sAY3a]